jgi:RNA polymerase sigma-70 factor (ECF subfamily)
VEGRILEPADQQLVERAKNGDRAAFRALVERYQQRVYGIAFGIVRHPEDAMDVTQEAFIKVHKHLARFQGSSSFYTWLYRIVVNLCIDHRRRSGRSRSVDFDDSLDHSEHTEMGPTPIRDPGSEFGRRELRGQIGRAVDELSDKHRQVILLREIEGLSYKEIADTLDISVGTVMSRLHHARQNLQVSLKRYMPERS